MNLTLTGPNGTQTINETEMSNLPAIRAYGGLLNQLGVSSDLGNYTGIPLTTLCDLVGGVANGSSVLVTASDNYSITLSYSQLNGNWTTYDKSTGQPVNQTQPLTPIIAYYFNDENLSSNMAPLQLAIVGPEGLLTDGKYWIHYVLSITIKSAAVPEFSAPSLIPAFMIATVIATMIAALVFRKKLETRKGRSLDYKKLMSRDQSEVAS
jgi:hypothetical protein